MRPFRRRGQRAVAPFYPPWPCNGVLYLDGNAEITYHA